MSGCQHNSSSCNHFQKCGQPGNLSPLQAFLTDNLKGFHVAQKSDPLSLNHLDNHPSGYMCHVPMGFDGKLCADASSGVHIVYALKPFCESSTSALRQLSEKLGCLTNRTPRTLGDLFGFMWHLNGQLFKTRPKLGDLINKFFAAYNLGSSPSITSGADRYIALTKLWKGMAKSSSHANSIPLSLSLESMAPAIPFLYQLFMAKDTDFLPGALFDLTKHCHKWDRRGQLRHESHSSGKSCPNPNDLWSLYQGLTATARQNKDIYEDCRKGNCGGYLYPLTHTFGSTFAPKHASTYLSWFLYLADDLETGLKEILERFKGLECTNCDKCSSGTHGSDSCKCPSLVECADVLPVLYDYGFSFNNAYLLKGWKNSGGKLQADTPNNRTCGKFSNQLSAVLASTQETPLLRLLHSIDDFLYLFRFYFWYNLSAIWMLYLCIILYPLFFMLDTLHIRSHLCFSSAHILPPIGLLTAGKAQALMKLTYFLP
ncbi:extracellular matrix-binding ebh [Babesia caballi]|uniref:Extracellular matrix-binding ebh n=1 Tax=Babesia caballi TaxID=5871 RepID=A0AAV4LR26_BABCB|nr:extracellular matrix-binding ebh [Babesia caballi]